MTKDMECEAHASSFIEDVLAFVSAQVLAIDRYLTGQLNRAEEEAAEPVPRQPAVPGGPPLEFRGKQALLHRLVKGRVTLSLRGQQAEDDVAWDAVREEADAKGHRPIVCSGRPGTGKTTVLHRNVAETLRAGGSVLVTIPTALLSTRMAAKLGEHDRLVVETAATAFRFHKPEQEALHALHGYDLVVVDEFSQLAQEEFERILRLWKAAEQLHVGTPFGG